MAAAIHASSGGEYEIALLAHARYFSALISQQGPRLEGDGTETGQLEALGIIRTEDENLDAAFDILAGRLESESAGSLLLPLARWLQRYLAMISSSIAMLRRFESLRAATLGSGLDTLKLQSLLACAGAKIKMGAYGDARAEVLRASELATSMAHKWGRASAASLLGLIERVQGNHDEARRHYAETLALSRELGDQHGVSSSLSNLGLVEQGQGNYRLARELFVEALGICRRCGDRLGTSSALNNLGIVEDLEGNYRAARSLYTDSLAMKIEIGDDHGIAGTLHNLGEFEVKQGALDAARDLFTKALDLNRAIGNRTWQAANLAGLGRVALAQDSYAEARGLFTQALKLNRAIGNRGWQSSNLYALGNVAMKLGEQRSARELHAESLAIACEIGDKEGICYSLVSSAGLLGSHSEPEAACICFFGAQHHAALLGLRLDPQAQVEVEAIEACLAAGSVGLSTEQAAHCRAQAQGLTLEALAQLALAELKRLPG